MFLQIVEKSSDLAIFILFACCFTYFLLSLHLNYRKDESSNA